MSRPTRILVLPGIGDILWVAVALRDFARRRNLEQLELHTWDFDGRRRGGEFIDRLPFVTNGGYFTRPPHPARIPEFQQSYHTGERSIFPGFLGFDYYLAANGVLRHGGRIQDAFAVEEDWRIPWRRTAGELLREAEYRDRYGRYLVAHFSEFGMFRDWTRHWRPEFCSAFLLEVQRATGCQILLTGSSWDMKLNQDLARRLCRRSGAFHNLAGQTDPETFYGMLHGCAGVVGWCGGNTILATLLGKPTLMGWSRKAFPNPLFYRYACDPSSWGRSYRAFTVERTSPSRAAAMFLELWNRSKKRQEVGV